MRYAPKIFHQQSALHTRSTPINRRRAHGTVTGAGTISPNKELNFKMLANLPGAGAAVTKVVGLGAGGIPVAVGGTTSNPTFALDMKAVASGKLKSVIPGAKSNPLGGVFGKKKSN